MNISVFLKGILERISSGFVECPHENCAQEITTRNKLIPYNSIRTMVDDYLKDFNKETEVRQEVVKEEVVVNDDKQISPTPTPPPIPTVINNQNENLINRIPTTYNNHNNHNIRFINNNNNNTNRFHRMPYPPQQHYLGPPHPLHSNRHPLQSQYLVGAPLVGYYPPNFIFK